MSDSVEGKPEKILDFTPEQHERFDRIQAKSMDDWNAIQRERGVDEKDIIKWGGKRYPETQADGATPSV